MNNVYIYQKYNETVNRDYDFIFKLIISLTLSWMNTDKV